MTWSLTAVLMLATGTAIGLAYGRAHHARRQFINHFVASRLNLRTWIVMSVRTAAIVAGLGLVLYAAIALRAG